MDQDAAAAIGSLSEPVRRDLYAYVCGQQEPVGRDQAAEAVSVPRHTAKFHLDRLVDEGLLEVDYQRLTGRSGPGAGRPAKVYRRADREIAVSLPARHYDLAGRILAGAVERAATGGDVMTAVGDTARAAGRAAGAASAASGDDLERLSDTLAEDGYEPRRSEERLVLDNCPFDQLARDHTELVCGLNLAYVEGVAEGLGCPGVRARLEPGVARCCVTASVSG
ncbi:MAG TPA: helix-turn-helix domain-containing protein [Nocardioides sp.]|nr:helix-turn-helix domain-containing protein [Nocardioides sp.]